MLLDSVYRYSYSLQLVQVPVQRPSTGTTKVFIIVILVPKIFRKRLHDETNKIGRELQEKALFDQALSYYRYLLLLVVWKITLYVNYA